MEIIISIIGACAIMGLIYGIDACIRLNKVEEELKKYKKTLLMKEEDFKSLRKWLVDHDYYVGNHEAAEALRKLADMWDD